MMKKNLWFLLTLLVAVMLALAACAGGGEEAAEETAAEEPAAQEEEEAAEEPAAEEAMEEGGDLAGTTVTIFGAFVDEDARRFEASMVPFEERTGIDIQYEGSGDFETLVLIRTEGGDPPDIAAFPQPGLLAGFVDKGQVIDLNDWFERDYLEQQYIQSWLDLATINGIMAGVWYRANVKSLVWYPVPEFEEAGYEIPETWDEMLALSDQMVADGNTPWCIGIESSGATGWVATDWMEDIMLRTQPPEKYDQWVAGQLPFDSPEVKNAAEVMGEIWFNPDYVFGGTTSILTMPFGDAPTPLFDDPPSCWMHRQASFIPAFFPEGVEVGTDVDFFYLPPIGDEFGRPVLGAGDIFGAFNDRPEVQAVMEYLTTGESLKAWIEAGGVVAPHNDAQLDWYPTDADRGYAEILQAATTFRFDASDLMPGAVGAGSFWTGMVDYVSGEDLDSVMQSIDASWPADATVIEPPSSEEAAEEEAMEEAPAAEMPEVDAALSGTTVTIFGAIVDEDARRFEASMEPFEEATGIDIEYEGSGDFETLVLVRAEGGDPPDIAAFPQPGLLEAFVSQGQTQDLNDWFEDGYLEQQYAQSWLDLATIEGQMAGAWYRANVKSLVWYPVPEFEEAGYEIPETWDEMLALSDQMVADGTTPWCIGIESSGATGWVATDWVEDIMLRTQPPEKYDQWVTGELPFNSPEVKNAVEIMGEIWLNPDYVFGGTTSILTVPFGDAPTPMFDDPPSCWLHRQANFIPAFFPEGVEIGQDVNYFYLPPIDEAQGRPVLGAGDLMAAFNDRPEVRAVMDYLTRGISTQVWVQSGGFVSPHNDTPLDWYPTDADRGYAEILQAATTFRFDASDLMPGAVGAGAFWTGMVDYVSGEDLDSVMQSIDNSWPQE